MYRALASIKPIAISGFDKQPLRRRPSLTRRFKYLNDLVLKTALKKQNDWHIVMFWTSSAFICFRKTVNFIF